MGLPTTVHVYINGKPGTQSLPLHSDAADVLVIQINGTKDWEVCWPAKLPTAQHAASNLLGIWAAWDDKRFAKAQNLGTKKAFRTGRPLISYSGTPYDDVNLDHYDCSHITMKPGDRLYMPFGILHRAVTGAAGSTHATFEFGKKWGIVWADLFLATVEYTADEDPGWYASFATTIVQSLYRTPGTASAAPEPLVENPLTNQPECKGCNCASMQLQSIESARTWVLAAGLLRNALRHDPGTPFNKYVCELHCSIKSNYIRPFLCACTTCTKI